MFATLSSTDEGYTYTGHEMTVPEEPYRARNGGYLRHE